MKTDWDKIRELFTKECMSISQISDLTGVAVGTIKARKNREEKKGLLWTRIVDAELVEANEESKKIITDMTYDQIHRAVKKRKMDKELDMVKYLPSELWDMMNEIEGMTVVDHLWIQIKMSLAGIIRAHKIMWVNDKDDNVSAPVSEGAEGSSYKVAFAFERYEAYIRTMTRAYAEHNKMIEQFLKLSHKDDPRRVKVIHMDLNVDKLQAETELAKLKLQEAKGMQKDTGMLETLLDSQREFEEMIKSGKFEEFTGGN